MGTGVWTLTQSAWLSVMNLIVCFYACYGLYFNCIELRTYPLVNITVAHREHTGTHFHTQ
jgi:hypothetical protein